MLPLVLLLAPAARAVPLGDLPMPGPGGDALAELDPPLVPGAQFATYSYDILDDEPVDTVFDLDFTAGALTPDKRHTAATGLQFVSDAQCAFNVRSAVFATYQEFESYLYIKTKRKRLFRRSKKSYSLSVQRQIEQENKIVAFSYVDCLFGVIRPVPGVVPLSARFVAEAQRLPSELATDADVEAFFRFFDVFGHAFPVSATVGGRLSSLSYTAQEFRLEYGLEATGRNAKYAFYGLVRPESPYVQQMTEAFKSSTTTEAIRATGGVWSFNTTFSDWAASVRAAPVAVDIEYGAITDLLSDKWALGAELGAKKAAAEQALELYLTRPGCLDMRADGYDADATVDDGSCPDAFTFSDEYELVPGGDNPLLLEPLSSVCFLVRAASADEQCSVRRDNDANVWVLGAREAVSAAGACRARCVRVGFAQGE